MACGCIWILYGVYVDGPSTKYLNGLINGGIMVLILPVY